MKFRNPETGEAFENTYEDVTFCGPYKSCIGCPIGNIKQNYNCTEWVDKHPYEAARLMGYEILDDTSSVNPLEIEEVKSLESEAIKEDTPMSTRIRPAVERLAEMEKQDANRKFPLFHSMHEGYAVLLEEAEEARESLNLAEGSLSMIWAHVREHALDLAVEAIQAAAMAQKFIDSAKKGETSFEQQD